MQRSSCPTSRASPTVAEFRGRVRSFAAGALAVAVWLYLFAVLLVWTCLRMGGDRWWWATVLLFGPRWIFALPLALLVPAALCCQRRLIWPLGAAAGCLCFAVLGLCAPWRTVLDLGAEGPAMRVLTFNADRGRGDPLELDRLVADLHPDVVALQECGEEFAPRFLSAPGWHVLRNGNLWLASRHAIEAEQSLVDDGKLGYWGTIAMRCRLETPTGAVRVIVLHLETPREGLEAIRNEGWGGRVAMQAEIKRRAKISALASELAGNSERTLVLGDFNMPVDSAIYRRDWSRFQNAFSQAGWGLGGSKMTRWFNVRVDHALASRDWQVVRSWLGPRLHSDHRPLIAELRMSE